MGKSKENVNESEFKNRPILEFTNGDKDKYPFSLGINKLKSVIEHLDEVYEFLKKHGEM